MGSAEWAVAWVDGGPRPPEPDGRRCRDAGGPAALEPTERSPRSERNVGGGCRFPAPDQGCGRGLLEHDAGPAGGEEAGSFDEFGRPQRRGQYGPSGGAVGPVGRGQLVQPLPQRIGLYGSWGTDPAEGDQPVGQPRPVDPATD